MDMNIHNVQNIIFAKVQHFNKDDKYEEFWTQDIFIEHDAGTFEMTLFSKDPSTLLDAN